MIIKERRDQIPALEVTEREMSTQKQWVDFGGRSTGHEAFSRKQRGKKLSIGWWRLFEGNVFVFKATRGGVFLEMGRDATASFRETELMLLVAALLLVLNQLAVCSAIDVPRF
ncbi:hypothetical protein NC651_038067 [Populus alba x Populus x berolinensis]|nr:hypothetical protein NC651_038067 [Populus alba x Populus x berolinensis]